jgi:hypothetical protein
MASVEGGTVPSETLLDSRANLEQASKGDAQASTEPPPELFTASTFKLVLMSLCTFGLYEVYWFYKNWVCIKKRTGENLSMRPVNPS